MARYIYSTYKKPFSRAARPPRNTAKPPPTDFVDTRSTKALDNIDNFESRRSVPSAKKNQTQTGRMVSTRTDGSAGKKQTPAKSANQSSGKSGGAKQTKQRLPTQQEEEEWIDPQEHETLKENFKKLQDKAKALNNAYKALKRDAAEKDERIEELEGLLAGSTANCKDDVVQEMDHVVRKIMFRQVKFYETQEQLVAFTQFSLQYLKVEHGLDDEKDFGPTYSKVFKDFLHAARNYVQSEGKKKAIGTIILSMIEYVL